MKNILKKRLERLMAKKTDLSSRAMASEDAAEIRSIGEQLKELNEEIKDINDEIANLEKEEDEKRSAQPAVPANAVPVNGDIRGAFGVANPTEKKKTNENPLASTEYRSAFMAYVQRGEKISADIIKSIDEYRSSLPAEQRANVPATTADTGAAIPLTIMREIINTVRKRYGNLYAKVRKMSIQGGVEFPIGSLQASFKWISEGTVSPRQNIGSLGKVSFGYHTAEIRIGGEIGNKMSENKPKI